MALAGYDLGTRTAMALLGLDTVRCKNQRIPTIHGHKRRFKSQVVLENNYFSPGQAAWLGPRNWPWTGEGSAIGQAAGNSNDGHSDSINIDIF